MKYDILFMQNKCFENVKGLNFPKALSKQTFNLASASDFFHISHNPEEIS
jgi:hypothetical protein